jgi:ornithine cyclodeaminase/alanine dehydrogenase-like protein (mu-crystallin family)
MSDPARLRVLSASEVRRALPMAEAVAAMKEAFRELSAGAAVVPPRARIRVEERGGDVLVMPAYSPAAGRVGLKVITLFERNREIGLPFIQAVVLVIDAATGAPAALMDGTALTAVRTGAASGAATDLLARPDVRKAAIFGAGLQARAQLEAVRAVRPIAEVAVFDPDRGRAVEFAARAARELGLTASAAATPAEALAGADVVCTATTAVTPVFADADLAPGSHVNAVGSYKPRVREIPSETVARALVFVDQREAAWEEAGDLIMPLEAGLITRDHVLAELGEVVAGTRPGRRGPGDVTLFKSVGLAVQDLAAAARALANAEKLGLGSSVAL